jgi:hypothetical protein
MKFSKSIVLIPLLGLLAAPVMADRGQDRFERGHDRQHSRIERGVRAGALTHREAKSLRKEQRHVSKMERNFKRDGHLDRFERRTLGREYAQARAHTRQLKHNDRYRVGHRHEHGRYDGRHHAYGHHDKRKYWKGHRHDDRSYARRYDDQGWSLSLGLWDTW